MAITVLHTKVSTIPDDADTTLVRPSDWNATHSLSGVGTMAEQDANAVAITGGTIDGTTLGATTPATVVATQVDITAQGDLRLQDTTGGEYVAIQAPATLASSYTLTMPTDDGTAGQALVTDGSGVLSWSSAASGDVYGPASATDNAIARYDGTTGKIIQNSVVTIADTTGNMAGVGTLSSGAITSSALTSGRVPYAGTAGLIQDAAAFTFDGTILSATRFAGALNGTVGATTASTGAFTTLSATGVATLSAGTVSNPALTTSGDTNTGIFFPAADTIAFVEGGTEVIRINSSSNVGIGTSSPGAKLAVVGTGYSPTITITDGATLNWDTSLGQVAQVTLGGNRTFAAPTNLVNGGFYSLLIIQDGTGSRTISWNAVFDFTGGTAPTLSTAAGSKDLITWRSDGTNMLEVGRSLGVA